MKASLNQAFPISVFPVEPIQKSDFIMVQHLGRSLPVRSADITHLQGEGNYTFICTRASRYLVSKCLKTLQEMLDGDFVRIHKSYIINTQHIKALWSDNIHLTCGKNIPIARRRIRETHEMLKYVTSARS